MQKTKIIDLRKVSMAKAKRVIKRLYLFKKLNNAKVNFNFLLPEKIVKKKKQHSLNRCPYCNSLLEENIRDFICSNNNMPKIIEEIKTTEEKYKEKTGIFLTQRANRFYDGYPSNIDKIKCNYIRGQEESKFLK